MDLLMVLIAILIFFLMLGVGTVIDKTSMKKAIKSPRGICVGLVSQILWMPFATVCLSMFFKVSGPEGVGFLIIGASPGGSISNIFSFWAGADVSLSVTMTFISSAACGISMPVLLKLYSPLLSTLGDIDIPYLQIAVSMGSAVIPVGLGAYVKGKSPVWAKRLQTLSSVLATLFIVFAMLFGAILNPFIFEASWKLWFISTVIFFLGAGGGVALSLVLKLARPSVMAVAFETGVQNSGLAISIITLTWADQPDLCKEMLRGPMIYAPMVYVDCLLLVLALRYYDKHVMKKSPTDDAETLVDKKHEDAIASIDDGDAEANERVSVELVALTQSSDVETGEEREGDGENALAVASPIIPPDSPLLA
jgi:predicted Na+-dependent transporter